VEMYGSTIAPTHLKERNFAEAAAPHIAEFVGTYLLVFAIAVCGILAERSYGPTAIGSILTVLVYIFQPISGAYLNPAASVAAGLVGQIPWKTVMAYVVLQITAGFIAGLACYEVFHLPMGVAPVAPFEFGDAAFLEVLYTAMLCFVILSVTASRTNNPSTNQNNFFGLAIGLVIVAGGHAAGRVSGAVLNPAAAIGLEVGGAVGGSLKPYGLAYAFAELFGGIIAAAFFRIARLHEDHGTEASTVSRLFCEFFGTLLLCITIGLCLPQHSATPWAAGAALSAIVYAMHDVSGGHVNPAVTVAAVLSGKCPLERGVAYWAVQLLGSFFAGIAIAAYSGILRSESNRLEPFGDFSWMSVFAVETAFTCILALVTLSVSSSMGSNLYFGIAIGSCLTLGGFAAARVSGLLNPAVVWSMAISAATIPETTTSSISLLIHCLAFCLFQIAGGILASSLHQLAQDFAFTKTRSF